MLCFCKCASSSIAVACASTRRPAPEGSCRHRTCNSTTASTSAPALQAAHQPQASLGQLQDYDFGIAEPQTKPDRRHPVRQRRGRSPFYLTANVYSMQPITFAIDDCWITSRESPTCSFDGAHQVHVNSTSQESTCRRQRASAARLPRYRSCTDRAGIDLDTVQDGCEAYATGHSRPHPQEFAGYENDKSLAQDAGDDLLPYYRFVQAHRNLLDRTSLAKVAVLYSLPAAKVETPEFERRVPGRLQILMTSLSVRVILSRRRWGTIRSHPPTFPIAAAS